MFSQSVQISDFFSVKLLFILEKNMRVFNVVDISAFDTQNILLENTAKCECLFVWLQNTNIYKNFDKMSRL